MMLENTTRYYVTPDNKQFPGRCPATGLSEAEHGPFVNVGDVIHDGHLALAASAISEMHLALRAAGWVDPRLPAPAKNISTEEIIAALNETMEETLSELRANFSDSVRDIVGNLDSYLVASANAHDEAMGKDAGENTGESTDLVELTGLKELGIGGDATKPNATPKR